MDAPELSFDDDQLLVEGLHRPFFRLVGGTRHVADLTDELDVALDSFGESLDTMQSLRQGPGRRR